MIRRSLGVIALIALLGLLLSACGDEDNESAQDPTATQTQTEASTPTPTPESEEAVGEGATTASPTAENGPVVVTVEGRESVQIIDPPERSDAIPQDARTLGSPDAEVVLAEYGDFQ